MYIIMPWCAEKEETEKTQVAQQASWLFFFGSFGLETRGGRYFSTYITLRL